MITFRFILLFLLTLLLSNCISQFDFEAKSAESYLVVDGKLTQKNVPHEILLSYSSVIGKALGNPISGATIVLYDSDNNPESYYELETGKYIFYGNSINRESNETYHIEISLPNGKRYQSIPQTMPKLIKANHVEYKVEKELELSEYGNTIEINYVNLYINTPITGKEYPNYFLWRVDEASSFTELFCSPLGEPKTCYIKRTVQEDEIKIFSSENLDGTVLSDYKVGSINIFPSWEFAEKHFYNVAQHVVSQEAYDYWETVQLIATPTGSIFDVPPAPIKGNIFNMDNPDEIVLGFFELSMVDTVRTKTWNYSDFEKISIIDRCNPHDYRARRDPACCNCLVLTDSDLKRPYYWGD